MKTVLCLANPKDTVKLAIEREFREIERALDDVCELEFEFNASLKSTRKAIAANDPHVIHFSGHGSKDGGIVLEDDDGKSRFVSGKDTVQLFANCGNLEVVVLNACYSSKQAKDIVKVAPYVVGMSDAIFDADAVSFAANLYNPIGHNQTVDTAFSLARSSHMITSSRDYIPILVMRGLSDDLYDLH